MVRECLSWKAVDQGLTDLRCWVRPGEEGFYGLHGGLEVCVVVGRFNLAGLSLGEMRCGLRPDAGRGAPKKIRDRLGKQFLVWDFRHS